MKKNFTILFSILLFTTINQQANAQVMVGSPIDGIAADGLFGQYVSISTDANRIAVDAPEEINTAVSNESGAIRFYDLDGTTSSYAQLDATFPFGESENVGKQVRLSDDGNRMAALGSNAFSNFSYTYDEGSNSWGNPFTITLSGELDMELAGNGNRAIIGHVDHTSVWDFAANSWAQMGMDIPFRGDHVAISADGTRVAISEEITGIARTFEWDSAGSSWNMVAQSFSEFGGDLALSADGSLVAVVSLEYDDVSIVDFAFTNLFGNLIANGTTDDVVISLSADGTRVVVGAKSVIQSTKVYDYDGAAWTQFGSTIEFSGGEVDMTPDGKYVVIGNPAANSNTGQVRVYEIDPVSAVTNIEYTDIEVFPNPTHGELQLANMNADVVQLFDNMGRLVFVQEEPGSSIDISNVPTGFYFLKMTESETVYSARVVKE